MPSERTDPSFPEDGWLMRVDGFEVCVADLRAAARSASLRRNRSIVREQWMASSNRQLATRWAAGSMLLGRYSMPEISNIADEAAMLLQHRVVRHREAIA